MATDLEIIIQQNSKNAKNLKEILDFLSIVVQQNKKNNANDNLEKSLLQNKKASDFLNNTLENSFKNLKDILSKINDKTKVTEKEDHKKTIENFNNELSKINTTLEFIKNKEDEKLADILSKISQKTTKLVEKNGYDDTALLKSIELLITSIDLIPQPKEFDYKKLADLNSDATRKFFSKVLNIDISKHQDPENALAVKIYDKDGKIIESFGGGGGPSQVNLKNIDQEEINPATEDKQDDIVTAIGNIEGTATDLDGGGKISVGTTAIEATFTGTTISIIITADIDNTGKLFIGKSDVDNTGANAITFLEAGDSVTIDYNDVDNAVYIVSDTASQNFWKGCLL